METTEAKVITRDYIKGFFQFDDSREDQAILDTIMQSLSLKEFPNNAIICRAGEEADAMYFLEAGACNVLDSEKDVINELKSGTYFGEYAALVGEKRMADIQAKGSVSVYRLDKETLLDLTRNNPKIYSLFLKNVYGQATERYKQLRFALDSRRGVNNPGRTKKAKLPALILNYGIVLLIFIAAAVFVPPLDKLTPLWLCAPIVFLVAYIIITRRTLEALILAAMFTMVMTARMNFVGAFIEQIVGTISDVSTLEILLLIAFMGSLIRLFTASGSINALRSVAETKLKSGKATLLTSFFCMFIVSIDDYLGVLIGSSCFMPLADQKRIPREKSAMVMGMGPTAICLLNPISLWGIYLTGLIVMSGGKPGVFIAALPFNFSAILVILFVFLLALGKAPLVGLAKKGVERVADGGPLAPPGSDDGAKADNTNRGKIINLILPIAVLIAASIISGTLVDSIKAGAFTFSVNVLYGILVTFLFTFVLYCFERYMTPEQFIDHIVFGIESMLAPIVMLIVVNCFSSSLEVIGFSGWLNVTVQSALGGQAWLLPAIIFVLFTIIGMLFGSSWAMFPIGIPLALKLAESSGGNAGLFIAAICAAGLSGDGLSMYNGDMFFFASCLGIKPSAYYSTKLPYVVTIAICAFAGFLLCGLLIR
ncbi:MAG: cyclic nucleotide-binding domain-containing protein [Treponema sp.]|jgi:Na+/H+ antiporter NhaC|nr:cyclic nucleotide-binding domain-containing protein [Treponema sp.]